MAIVTAYRVFVLLHNSPVFCFLQCLWQMIKATLCLIRRTIVAALLFIRLPWLSIRVKKLPNYCLMASRTIKS